MSFATFSRCNPPWRIAVVRLHAVPPRRFNAYWAANAEFICSPGTYDQKHIDRIGKLRDCIAYGPGILDLAHQPDEYVLDRRHGEFRESHGAVRPRFAGRWRMTSTRRRH